MIAKLMTLITRGITKTTIEKNFFSIFHPFWRLCKGSECHKLQEGKGNGNLTGTCTGGIPDTTGAFVDKNGKNLKITQAVAQVIQSLAAIFRAVF